MALGGAAIGWIVALSTPRDFAVGHFVDDAHYAVLAKSIRERGTYRTISLPLEPSETKYPPGFPLVMAAAWSPDRSGADNLTRLRWVNLLLLGPLTAGLALLALDVGRLPPVGAMALALAAVVHPGLAELWTVPLSEPLWLLLVTGGVLLCSLGRYRQGLFVLVAATYVRTVAVGFVVAALALRLRRRSQDAAAVGDAVWAVALLAPWGIWGLHRNAVPEPLLGMYGSYGAWYLDSLLRDPLTVLLRVPWQNGTAALELLGRALVGGWAPGLLLVGVGGVVVWRVVVAAREAPLLVLGLGCYVAMALVWPFPIGRFVGAAWPLVLVAVGRSAGRYRVLLPVLALAVAVPQHARGGAVRGHRNRAAQGETLIAAMQARVPAGAVVASTNPALHYLRLGVPAVPVQRLRSYRAYRLGFWSTAWGLGDDLWAITRRYRPALVAVERRGVEGRFAVGSLMAQCPGVLTLIWESAELQDLFAVEPDAACNPRATRR